jgi:glutamate synthase domain-containing protein 1
MRGEDGRVPGRQGLYDPQFERAACGVGFVVDIKGRRSHAVVEQGIQLLVNLLHRGACGCEANTGDGAGILVQMPDRFLRKEAHRHGIALPGPGDYGAGLVFLPRDRVERHAIEALVRRVLEEEDLRPARLARRADRRCAARRESGGLGARLPAAVRRPGETLPLRRRPGGRPPAVRAQALRRAEAHRARGLVSLSSNTLTYKGMLTADQIAPMFPDLLDPDLDSALALVHQRFSTNTFPSWPLAHPYRFVAHNGEINTLRGNINWMRAREGLLRSDVLGDDLAKILPIIREGGSDTACFDNVLEFLVMAGARCRTRCS